MDQSISQQAYLKQAKQTLQLTWDGLAEKSGIHPRALKTYRMPETSADYRPMPPLARKAIDQLILEAGGMKPPAA